LDPHASAQYESPNADAHAATRMPRWRKVSLFSEIISRIRPKSPLRRAG
jgi:hypothetical protein